MEYKEKILLLENKIKEFALELGKIEVAHKELKESCKAIRDRRDPNKYNKEIDIERRKIADDLEKKANYQYLEKMRVNSRIIRSISINTSEYLEPRINEVEDIFKECYKIKKEILHCHENNIEHEKLHDELDTKRKELREKSHNLHVMIDLCKMCIKDTLDKIRN